MKPRTQVPELDDTVTDGLCDSDVPLVSRGRFSILSTESDNDEEDAGQSMPVAVATGCAGDCDRVAVPMEDNGRRNKRLRISQATTVAIPPESFVDRTQRDVSGSDTHLCREMHLAPQGG